MSGSGGGTGVTNASVTALSSCEDLVATSRKPDAGMPFGTHISTLAVIPDAHRLAPFNPTSGETIQLALAALELTSEDLLVDIGAGDGRVLIAAARAFPGIRCWGIERDEAVWNRGQAALREESDDVRSRCTLVLGDALEDPMPPTATAVFAYLVPAGMARVEKYMSGILLRGGRVATNMFSVKQWEDMGSARHTIFKTSAGLSVHLYRPGLCTD